MTPHWTEAAIAAELEGKFFDIEGIDLNAERRSFAAQREERKALQKKQARLRAIAEIAIKRAFEVSNGSITAEAIIFAVASAHHVEVAEIIGCSRKRHIIRARQHACALMRKLTGKPSPKIAHAVGLRDHSTVIHAVKTWHLHDKNYVKEDAAARKMLGVQ